MYISPRVRRHGDVKSINIYPSTHHPLHSQSSQYLHLHYSLIRTHIPQEMSPSIARNEPPPHDPSGRDARGANIPVQKAVEEQLADQDMALVRRVRTTQAPTWLNAVLKVVMDTTLKTAFSMLRLGLENMMWACGYLIMLSITSWVVCQAPGARLLPMCANALAPPCYVPLAYRIFDFCPLPVQQTPLVTGYTNASMSYMTSSEISYTGSTKELPTTPLDSGHSSPSIPQETRVTNGFISSAMPITQSTSFESTFISSLPQSTPLTQAYEPSPDDPLMVIPSQIRSLIKDLERHEYQITNSGIPRRIELSSQIRAIKENTLDNLGTIEKWVIGVVQFGNDALSGMKTVSEQTYNKTPENSKFRSQNPSTSRAIDSYVQLSKEISYDADKLQQSSLKATMELGQLQNFLHSLRRMSLETITRVREHLKTAHALAAKGPTIQESLKRDS